MNERLEELLWTLGLLTLAALSFKRYLALVDEYERVNAVATETVEAPAAPREPA